jgi:hypothetical protein
MRTFITVHAMSATATLQRNTAFYLSFSKHSGRFIEWVSASPSISAVRDPTMPSHTGQTTTVVSPVIIPLKWRSTPRPTSYLLLGTLRRFTLEAFENMDPPISNYKGE